MCVKKRPDGSDCNARGNLKPDRTVDSDSAGTHFCIPDPDFPARTNFVKEVKETAKSGLSRPKEIYNSIAEE